MHEREGRARDRSTEEQRWTGKASDRAADLKMSVPCTNREPESKDGLGRVLRGAETARPSQPPGLSHCWGGCARVEQRQRTQHACPEAVS